MLQEKFPSLYEAQTLQGDIYKAIGDEQRDTGKIVEAEQSYANARAAYQAAATKGQSDPSIFVGLCALQNGIMRMQSQQIGISPHKAYEESISYCNLALQRIMKIYLLSSLARGLMSNGGYIKKLVDKT